MSVFKQQFSVFKQHFTYFNTLFHPHVFPQKFSNNNFQFLNTCTKRALRFSISLETPKFKTFPHSSYSFPRTRSKISWHSRKFEDNQWQIRSRIQTPSVFGSSPSISTWLRRPMALISLTVPSKVLSTYTLKRRR